MDDIRALTPELLPDFLEIMKIGFSDNPDWFGCYCYFHHFPGTVKEWSKQTKEQNHEASIELIRSGKLNGFLAYDNNEPIGWCKADDKENFVSLPYKDASVDPQDGKIASIACFLIEPLHRKQGITKQLIRFASSYFTDKGFDYLEGYPNKKADSDAHHYHGPYSLYISEGFTVFKELKNFYVMRKLL